MRGLLVAGLAQGDDGQDLVEYAMLVGLIALVAIVGVTSVGNAISLTLWQTVTSGLGTTL